MARQIMSRTGVSGTLTQPTGTAAVNEASNGRVIVANNSDATVKGTLNVPSDTQLNEYDPRSKNYATGGAGVNRDVELQPFEYKLFRFIKTGTTASDITLTLTTNHRTSAQLEEEVFLGIVS